MSEKKERTRRFIGWAKEQPWWATVDAAMRGGSTAVVLVREVPVDCIRPDRQGLPRPYAVAFSEKHGVGFFVVQLAQIPAWIVMASPGARPVANVHDESIPAFASGMVGEA